MRLASIINYSPQLLQVGGARFRPCWLDCASASWFACSRAWIRSRTPLCCSWALYCCFFLLKCSIVVSSTFTHCSNRATLTIVCWQLLTTFPTGSVGLCDKCCIAACASCVCLASSARFPGGADVHGEEAGGRLYNVDGGDGVSSGSCYRT